jgi:FecR protein
LVKFAQFVSEENQLVAMKKISALAFCLGYVFAATSGRALDLKQSKVTQVVNDVEIISAADQSQKNAAVNDLFKMPDILKTGEHSRAELVAEDETVTRVGANTIFSFDPANRTIDLKQGSLLFHSPHGKGGGTIHTGSATASVLGTTLIITTTPSGGFKVLDLEGSVEVKFLNGLSQKLAPGQMSFVLPGGNQLAPIIVFRLDDLTKNSQLVKGFNASLASMPLIQQQVQKQIAAIQSGKMSDTGKYVGSGDATPNSVPVIDPNTLQTALDGASINSPAVTAALSADASVPPLSSQHVFTTEPILLPNNPFYLGQPFEGFAARNIYFTPTPLGGLGIFPVNVAIPVPSLTVNLSAYTSLPEFDFVAANNILLNSPSIGSAIINFTGLTGGNNNIFSLIAGNQILVGSGTTVRADCANFQWECPALLELDSATVLNSAGNTSFTTGSGGILFNNSSISTYGNLGLKTAGDVTINGSTFTANSAIVNASGQIAFSSGSVAALNTFGIFNSQKDITLANAGFQADANSGLLEFDAAKGKLNISGTSFNTGYLVLNSGDGILLDGTGATFTGGRNATANFTATGSGAAIGLSNADFSHYAQMNISADTVNLLNVAFNNTVNIFSRLGTWNNGSSQPGCVNDLGNVTYNGTLVSAANGASGQIGNTGITVSRLH